MAEFVIQAIIEPTGVRKGAADVNRSLDKLEDRGRRLRVALKRDVVIDSKQPRDELSRVQRKLEETGNTASKVGARIKQAIAGITFLVAIRQVQLLTDTYTNLQNRLRTVVATEEQLVGVTEELFDISNRTRSAYEGTAEVYARVALATKDLGTSSAELLAFTESLNQAIILSGASAAEAQAGLIQLSQGLASGTLRGDELRSVLEQLPAVADVIAKSMGVTRGELRKMGEEGKINAEVVLGAFREAREELADKFAKTVPTVGQSFVVLRNNILEAVGGLDKATGASAAVAGALIFVSDNLDLAAGAALVLAATYGATLVPATLTAAAATAALQARVLALGKLLLGNPFGIAVLALTATAVAASKAGKEFDKLAESTANAVEQNEKFALTDFGKVGADILQVQKNLARVEAEIARDTASGGVANPIAIAQAERYRAELANLGVQQEALRSGAARTTVQAQEQARAVEALTASTQEAIVALGAENELLLLSSREREVQVALLRELDRLQKAGGPEVSEAQRAELEAAIRLNQARQEQADILDRIQGPQQRYEADLAALNALLAEDRITQEAFNAELARMAELAAGVSLAELGVDAGTFAEGLKGAKLEEFLAALERLRSAAPGSGGGAVSGEPQGAGKGAGRGVVGAGVSGELQLQADVYAQIVGPQAQYKANTEALNALFASGAIDVQQYTIAMNEAAIAANTLGSSAATGAAAGLAKIHNQLLDVGGQVEATLVNGFNAAEDALVSFVQTGELDFSRLVDSILADLTRLALRQGLLALLGGGAAAPAAAVAGGGGGGFGGYFGGGRAGGGDVNRGTPYLVGERGPELFTPRNAGAITPAGETAAMLQQGRAAAAAPPTVNVAAPAITIVNVQDPNEVPRGIESPAGQQAILNVISGNRRKVKSSL